MYDRKIIQTLLSLLILINNALNKICLKTIKERRTDHGKTGNGNLASQLWTGVNIHTDRGSQYCSNDFQKVLKRHKMISSMSRKGDCLDNTVAESSFASLKTERVFLNNYKTREAARKDIFH